MSVSLETLVPQEEPVVVEEEPPAPQEEPVPPAPQEEEPPEEAPAPVEEVIAPAPKKRGRPRKDPAAPAPKKAVKIKAPPPVTPESSNGEPIDRDDMETLLLDTLSKRKQTQQDARRTMWARLAGLR